MLTRDPRDSTLGIDLDQFTGRPTIAVVVPGGPAERDGSVRAGDIISAVDGVECKLSARLLPLSSPTVAAKNPLPVTLVRRATHGGGRLLAVRALPRTNARWYGRDKHRPRKSEGLWRTKEHTVSTSWKECRCVLFSDRRITIVERKLGVDASFGLRSTEMVALVQIPTKPSNTQERVETAHACIRTADGIIEMCESKQRAMTQIQSPPPLAWQRLI